MSDDLIASEVRSAVEAHSRERLPVVPFLPLASRTVVLKPIQVVDYPFLYNLFVSGELAFRWRFRGLTPSPDAFARTLWQNVLAQFIIRQRSSDQPAGLISAYSADFKNKWAYLAIVMEPSFRRSRCAHEAGLVFLNYLFEGWDFRKLYGEVGELSFSAFPRGGRGIFRTEGVLKGHEYFRGRYWDTYIVAIYRDDWESDLRKWFDRVVYLGD